MVNDFRKVHKRLYNMKQNHIDIFEVPKLKFLIAEGVGERNIYNLHQGDEMWSVVRVCNRLKEMTKNTMDYRFKLMPMEVIWSNNDSMNVQNENATWNWSLMMMVPDLITDDLFQEALFELDKRNRSIKVPVELKSIDQGLCAQALHIGSYGSIEDTIEKIHTHLKEENYEWQDDRREIYVNQPFCHPPEKLQTIVRLTVKKAK